MRVEGCGLRGEGLGFHSVEYEGFGRAGFSGCCVTKFAPRQAVPAAAVPAAKEKAKPFAAGRGGKAPKPGEKGGERLDAKEKVRPSGFRV